MLDDCMKREGEGEGDRSVCVGAEGRDKLRGIDILKKRSGQWREEKAKKGGMGEKGKRRGKKRVYTVVFDPGPGRGLPYIF